MVETSGETLREQVKLLWFQGLKGPVICAKTGVKPGTLKTWVNRYGWRKTADKLQVQIVDRAMPRVIADAQRGLQAISERVRGTMGGKIEQLAGKLSEMPAGKRVGDLKAQSEVLESLTRASKPVFGWGDETVIGLVAYGAVDEPAIDVQAELLNDNLSNDNMQSADNQTTRQTDNPIVQQIEQEKSDSTSSPGADATGNPAP